jgi:hypothetical protein
MKKTLLVILTALIAATGLASVSAGTADARWQTTPRIAVMGEEVWTVGHNCRGSFHAGLKNDPRKPGRVQLTIRSKGFTSNTCKTRVKFVFHNTRAPFNHERFFTVTGTKKRNVILAQKEFWIGSGVDLISVSSTSPASKGISYYIAIP